MTSTDPGSQDAIKVLADKEDIAADDGGRHYFSSTLIPLLAGTFGPMASTFSICALVKNWRLYVPDGSTEDQALDIPDPPWLLAINALSLVAALVGNLTLLLNMAKRLRFSVAQPITIGGFYLASILLIVDMAALTSSSDLRIDLVQAQPAQNHFLTSAFYYAVWAASLYFIIASLMCVTVYGANKGYYEKSFKLTTSQRSLMLQTMSFFVYLMVGALIWSKLEGWEYLDAVYWTNVTLLTIGLGDYVPSTTAGKALLFPYAVGGIVTLGLVVGSIRTLVLERGEEKLTARITESRRSTAIDHINVDHNTIRVGWFTKTAFKVESGMLPAQRREEEFNVMRAVQVLAERERRYFALALSAGVALILWFVGAAIFYRAEGVQQLDYLTWLFFAYTSLLTIGYGTPYPSSNAGKAFFVFWSLLAIPSLTILISNMGDTVVKIISELTDFIGAITVLPGEHGFKATVKMMLKKLKPGLLPTNFVGPGLLGGWAPSQPDEKPDTPPGLTKLLDHLADRISRSHFSPKELDKGAFADSVDMSNQLDCDIAFYHYVLSREVRNVMKHLKDKPPKRYSWVDWEYYIRLMGNLASDEDDAESYPGQKIPNALVPQTLAIHPRRNREAREAEKQRKQSPTSDGSSNSDPDTTAGEEGDKNAEGPHLHGHDEESLQLINSSHTWQMPWSWLSNDSPLMCAGSESEWIVQRLSAALERELNRTRRGFKRTPPISYIGLRKWLQKKLNSDEKEPAPHEVVPSVSENVERTEPEAPETPQEELDNKVRTNLEQAAASQA